MLFARNYLRYDCFTQRDTMDMAVNQFCRWNLALGKEVSLRYKNQDCNMLEITVESVAISTLELSHLILSHAG